MTTKKKFTKDTKLMLSVMDTKGVMQILKLPNFRLDLQSEVIPIKALIVNTNHFRLPYTYFRFTSDFFWSLFAYSATLIADKPRHNEIIK